MIPAISQVCTLNAAFETDVADFKASACDTIELWLGKLDRYLDSHTPEDVKCLLAEHEMTAPVASFQGGLLTSQGEKRKEAWDLFARRLELLEQLGVQTLVVAGDIHGPLSDQDVERVRVSLVQAAQQAAARGLRIALEFQATATLPNNLQSAIALVLECEEPNLGLCLDAFHYYTGPSKPEDLAWLSSEKVFHVQVCDVCGRPRELATDADRILPGDGDFVLEPIIAALHQTGYQGVVSLEVMNPMIWQVPPRQVGEVGMTALRKLLGQASMG